MQRENGPCRRTGRDIESARDGREDGRLVLGARNQHGKCSMPEVEGKLDGYARDHDAIREFRPTRSISIRDQ